jgi:hypothetical protein
LTTETEAQAAFAAGWALSGGPMTERVQAGCVAAVSLALEHAGDPAVFEATLHLGALTGVWATVYARQDHLYAMAAESLAVLWRKLLHGLDIAAVVTAIRREAAMTDDGSPAPGTDSQSATAAKYHKRAVRDIAAMLIAGLLAGLPSLALWPSFLAAITASLTAAGAEGFASALAVAASQAGHHGFDWDGAVQDAPQSPAEPGTAEVVASAIVAGAVTDLAVTLAGMAAAGATAAAMTAAVRAYLQDPKALAAYLQHAMGGSLSAAWLAVYDTAQVQRLLWVTAGDAKVCPVCDAYEARNPWTTETFPAMPAHVNCRCVPQAEDSDAVSPDMYADYTSQRRAA